MADEADITAERDESEYAMRLAASRKPVGPAANGSCHWCEEPVPKTVRYCDAECRDFHAREQKLKGRTAG